MINRKNTLFALLAAPLALFALPAHAALRVFACEPEWGALAQELGGSLVDVSVATSALQDPHQIQAKPSLIARARNRSEDTRLNSSHLRLSRMPSSA